MDTVTDNRLTVFETVDFNTPEGASTSGLPSDSGTALYKKFHAAPLTANFGSADPPTVVANLVSQQLQTADDMICQAMNLTEVGWGSPWVATPPKTRLMSDMTWIREQLQAIRCRLSKPAGPGTESHAAAIADNTPQHAISSFPGLAEQCSIAPDLARNAAAHMHQHYGVHGKCSSSLPADELGRSEAPTGAVRALGDAFSSDACAAGECSVVAPATPQDNGGEPLPSGDRPHCPECGTAHTGPYFAHVLCQSRTCSNIFSMDVARALGTHFESPAAEMTRPSPASQRIERQPSGTGQPPQQVCVPPAPPLLNSGGDVACLSDARRNERSGMPPANNQARTDLLSGESSELLAASLPRPQLPQEGQSLDSRDAELGDMAPTGSAREPLGLCPTMDNLLSSGDVNRLPPESCAQGGPDVLAISDRALGSAQSTIASAPIDHALGMHANEGQVTDSGDAEGLPQQSSMQARTWRATSVCTRS